MYKMENQSNNIIVIGSCMIDFVCYASRLPVAGETIHGIKFQTNFGGKGANQCVAAAKLGGKTTFVACVGNDDWGEKYIKHLAGQNINTNFIRKINNVSTGIAQITVSSGDGQNQIVIVGGANDSLNINDLNLVKKQIENAKVVVLQLETNQQVAMKALEMNQNGVTILNGAPAPAEYDEKLLRLPKIFCVNETEAAVFANIKVTNKAEAEEACKILIVKGCNSVVLTMGSEGALYINKTNPKEILHIKTSKVVAVDSTGAGDAFIGALAYFSANYNNMSMKEMIEKACFIATCSVCKPGSQNSFPDKKALTEFSDT